MEQTYKCERVGCGKTFTSKTWRKYCLAEEGEKRSKCQELARSKQNRTNESKYTTFAIRKEIFVEPTYDVKCLKCDEIFKGNKGHRICTPCAEFNYKTPTREPRTCKLRNPVMFRYSEGEEYEEFELLFSPHRTRIVDI